MEKKGILREENSYEKKELKKSRYILGVVKRVYVGVYIVWGEDG